MKYCILSLLLALAFCASAQTILVSGLQSGTWSADTILVTNDVVVDGSLEIAAGTTVLFDGFYGITVPKGATFSALGTEDEGIVFTVNDTANFYVYNAPKGGWNGFLLDQSGPVRMDYCLLQYGKASDTLDQHGGAVNIQNCDDVEFNHTTFHSNFAREHGGAINAEHSKVTMHNCCLDHNQLYTSDNLYFMYGGAARFINCDVVMEDMQFLDNYGAISIGGALSLDSCSVIMDRAEFRRNIGLNGGGMYIMRCNDKECRLSNILFDDNFGQHFAGAIAFCDASPEVYNMTLVNNSSWGVNCQGIFFYQYSAPILHNCIIYHNCPEDLTQYEFPAQMWLWTFEDYKPEMHNCLVEGGDEWITNVENFKVIENLMKDDPLFVDFENHDFHLSEESPCRDAGTQNLPSYILDGFDVDGLPRVANGRIDLGCYEYSAASIGESSTQDITLCGNPLSSNSSLSLNLAQSSDLMMKVYDMMGRLVMTQTFGYHQAGEVNLSIGSLSDRLVPGCYMLEVVSANENFMVKLLNR